MHADDNDDDDADKQDGHVVNDDLVKVSCDGQCEAIQNVNNTKACT